MWLQVVSKTLSPQWECCREFSVADVSRCRFTVRLLDFDALTADDALGDVELDVRELFEQEEAVHFHRRTTKVGTLLLYTLHTLPTPQCRYVCVSLSNRSTSAGSACASLARQSRRRSSSLTLR